MFLKIFVVLLSALFVYFYFRNESRSRNYLLFKLKVRDYVLIGCDLNRQKIKLKLSHAGCFGLPDCVFKSRKGKEIIIGEYKSRKFKGFVRLREYYQVILYMGIAGSRFPGYKILGRIRFSDQLIHIDFSADVYEALLDLKYEAERVIENQSSGFVSLVLGKKYSEQPLHVRRRLRLPSYVKSCFAD